MKIKIPQIKRYNLDTRWKSCIIIEREEEDGKWVRYSDIEWVLLNFEQVLKNEN